MKAFIPDLQVVGCKSCFDIFCPIIIIELSLTWQEMEGELGDYGWKVGRLACVSLGDSFVVKLIVHYPTKGI